ncbi:hypothetical protein [Arthrobacter sp. VKM Ac-2550]|uniref:DUF7793 family protein n=1 Tax=Crystallibacter permensis TaxID=1938888 RepID=UPI0022272015|nr:hypothetical protein [Arthrobacter sp. VKM Ac-2550]MCW2135008.1 hypothetical protein [Arthrobacter sp. VKM Ac-2550]
MSKASLVLRGDGLLHLQWEPGSRIEEEDAKAAMIAVDSICEDQGHPMLVDMVATASVSRAARTMSARRPFTCPRSWIQLRPTADLS